MMGGDMMDFWELKSWIDHRVVRLIAGRDPEPTLLSLFSTKYHESITLKMSMEMSRESPIVQYIDINLQ